MMRNVHIVGDKGNMASRYKAILNHFRVNVTGHDLGPHCTPHLSSIAEARALADGFIICTPTDTHLDEIEKHLYYDKPILCEKPLVCDSVKLEGFLEIHKEKKHLITMINQYSYIDGKDYWDKSIGTYYSYFKSGTDGIYWDTINIIGQAEGKVRVDNESPVWTCFINNQRLSIEDMDMAYLSMLCHWMIKPEGNMAYALEAHKKVEKILNEPKNMS